MIEADLRPRQSFFFQPPVHDLKLSTSQQFARFGDGFGLPVGMQMGFEIRVGFIGVEFPNISAVMLTRSSNCSVYGVTAELTVDLLAAPGTVTSIEERIVRKWLNDSLLVQHGKIIPLSTDEQYAYENVDSTLTMVKAFEPKGFIAGFLKKIDVFSTKRSAEMKK